MLTSSISKASSWAWKSLHECITLLNRGLRWNVSNGSNILIWEDKRVPSLTTLPNECLRCDNEVESLEHILFHSPIAKVVWRASSLHYDPKNIGFSSFFNWWIEVNEQFPNFGSFSATSLAAWICWEIWRSQNLWTSEGIKY
ncbi:hypothetical protein V6Z11_D01G118700 [Gossypium hirsutum]